MRAPKPVGNCLWAGVILLAAVACSNDLQVIRSMIDPEVEPDMQAFNVTMDYSDSAVLQMRLTTPLIRRFTELKPPRDSFPEGIHVVMYEPDGSEKADIRADWAVRDSILWDARGNVVVTKADGTKIESEQMFWDQSKGIVYSDKFTRYSSASNTAVGNNGFWAKQDFTVWKLINGNAVINFKDSVTTATPTANVPDSIAPAK